MKSKVPSGISLKRSLNTLLEGMFWLPTLSTRTLYSRIHDDSDGDASQQLEIIIAVDGDTHVMLPRSRDSLRFRTWGGGGHSLRVRNALLVLAEAIRRDNEQEPLALQHAYVPDRNVDERLAETFNSKVISQLEAQLLELSANNLPESSENNGRQQGFKEGVEFALQLLKSRQQDGSMMPRPMD